jgi:[ribosomal protein S5]-alanine N-acetyltransferase
MIGAGGGHAPAIAEGEEMRDLSSRTYVEVGPLVVRGLEHRDVPDIVSYWYDTPWRFRWAMGVDPARQPPRAEWAYLYGAMVGADPETVGAIPLMGTFGGRPFGYALLDEIERGVSCRAHLHVFAEDDRRRGLVRRLFAPTLAAAFELAAVQTIVCEPSADNVAANDLLAGFGFEPVRRRLKPAQGICREMEVCRYELPRPAPAGRSPAARSSVPSAAA